VDRLLLENLFRLQRIFMFRVVNSKKRALPTENKPIVNSKSSHRDMEAFVLHFIRFAVSVYHFSTYGKKVGHG
jgi:hypothetical protein